MTYPSVEFVEVEVDVVVVTDRVEDDWTDSAFCLDFFVVGGEVSPLSSLTDVRDTLFLVDCTAGLFLFFFSLSRDLKQDINVR